MTIIKGLCDEGDYIEVNGRGIIVCVTKNGLDTDIEGTLYNVCDNCRIGREI